MTASLPTTDLTSDPDAALVVVDVQAGSDDPSRGGPEVTGATAGAEADRFVTGTGSSAFLVLREVPATDLAGELRRVTSTAVGVGAVTA